MKVEKVSKEINCLVQFLEKKEDLRIDEKIAICRAAGDFYTQIMATETAIASIRKSLEDFHKGDK